MNWAKIGLFAGGALFGSAGIEILTSKDAKKLYTQCTAAVLRMKDQVMKTATTLQENCWPTPRRSTSSAPPRMTPFWRTPPRRRLSKFSLLQKPSPRAGKVAEQSEVG